jgi:uridine phosphorylase
MSTTELQYHIKLKKGDVGRYVLLPGDPGRVPLIASYLTDARKIAENREHQTFTGTLDGVPVSVTSTGIGGPSTAIAVEELAKAGSDTFIRVGTSGKMQDYMSSGDLIVVSAAIRDEGTALQYMPMAFSAVADLDVVNCLRNACEVLGAPYHVGISHSKDSFYGEVEPERMPMANLLKERWQAWVKCGALCSEMEAAALYVIARTLGIRAGGLMIAHGTHNSLELLCKTAVESVRQLIRLDSN